MLKKLTALLLALLLSAAALAEVYEGKTAALSSVSVNAGATGTLAALECQVGERVEAGDLLARLNPERAFASQDGTVSLVQVEAGENVDGAVLELAPLEKYLIYCTVDGATQAAETTLVHSGETVYVRCTADGSHRAVGIVTQVDGDEYRMLTLGGELYIGETVYLYRDLEFTTAQRIGSGTVVSNDTEIYEASGTVTRLCVQAGDAVERGQLLYELGGGEAIAPVSGIVTEIEAQVGDAVEAEQALIRLVPDDQICVEIQAEESDAAWIQTGQRAWLTLAGDEEAELAGTVLDVAWMAEDGLYTVRIHPDDATALPLGMSVTVRLQEQ